MNSRKRIWFRKYVNMKQEIKGIKLDDVQMSEGTKEGD